jgi:hypothetical protein
LKIFRGTPVVAGNTGNTGNHLLTSLIIKGLLLGPCSRPCLGPYGGPRGDP